MADLFIFLRDIRADVREVREEFREEFFQADAGFIESLDWKQESPASFDRLIDDGQVVERPSPIEEVDLAVGLGMNVLLDEFSICEIAKRHALGDALDFFVMSVEEIARDKPIDGVADKADCVDVRVFVMIGEVEGEFVIGEAADPGVAADDFADIFASVLLGLEQGV